MAYTLSPKGSAARVSAIVLAAGTSTRMGQAKQLLPLGPSNVLAQTLENVRAASLAEIVLVLGSSAQAICHQLPPPLLEGLKVVINHAYMQGMASSLREGLSALDQQSDAALIVLGDQPFVRPRTLDRIVDAYRRSPAQIVIPVLPGHTRKPGSS